MPSLGTINLWLRNQFAIPNRWLSSMAISRRSDFNGFHSASENCSNSVGWLTGLDKFEKTLVEIAIAGFHLDSRAERQLSY
jgi:hypothetical protein